jgi:DNA-binding response OmpR family regulator
VSDKPSPIVVMLTGDARREILMRSMEAGAADFIVKPFTPDALIAKLTKFLPSLR